MKEFLIDASAVCVTSLLYSLPITYCVSPTLGHLWPNFVRVYLCSLTTMSLVVILEAYIKKEK